MNMQEKMERDTNKKKQTNNELEKTEKKKKWKIPFFKKKFHIFNCFPKNTRQIKTKFSKLEEDAILQTEKAHTCLGKTIPR